MKTFAEIARDAHVSKQTLYNAVQSSKIQLDDIVSKKQGKTRFYDADAEQIIVNALSKKSRNDEKIQSSNKSKDGLDFIEKSKFDELTKDLEKTNAELMKAQEEITRLKAIEDELRHQVSNLVDIQKAEVGRRLMLEASSQQTGLLEKIKIFFIGSKKQ